jgi:hypothetical protein
MRGDRGHESGTRARLRRALARLAARAGRPCHAVYLDVDPEQAVAAQRGRDRRPVPRRSMAPHQRSWRILRARLRSGGALSAEGYASARALDRRAAASIERIRFGDQETVCPVVVDSAAWGVRWWSPARTACRRAGAWFGHHRRRTRGSGGAAVGGM